MGPASRAGTYLWRWLAPAVLLVGCTAAESGSEVSTEAASPAADASREFRIDPVRPIDELRAEALLASPPSEPGEFAVPDLVDLASVDATIHFDIRYATSNNFMGTPFYESARAFVQRPVAEALVRAHRSLARHGYGLMIHDAYRPWHVTRMFWDATPEELRDFVADPAKGSRHNRGAAVDVTLYDLATGRTVEMPTDYDEFSERAAPNYTGGTAAQRDARDLLRREMQAAGFEVYEHEWWHFDHEDWRRYPILNETFEALDARSAVPAG